MAKIQPRDAPGCPVASGPVKRGRFGLRGPVPGVATYRPDIYSPGAIRDPYPHYTAMRDLGPVVWLPKQRVYALPRYAEVRAALSDDAAYRSANGVPLNLIARVIGRKSTLLSDGEEHDNRRNLLAHRLTPRSLRPLHAQIDELAERAVREAVGRGVVDGVDDIALAMPMSIVPDLVGWPERGRDKLVHWAGAIFDNLGPLNLQTVKAAPAALSMLAFVHSLARRRDVVPGSMAQEVVDRIKTGELGTADCRGIFIDYLAPSIDTTAGAIGSALWLFAKHPEQWELLKQRPELVPGAANEVIRIESPLRAFGRLLAAPTAVGDVLLPAGSRVLMMYSSANRDERVWQDPERFDITRDATGQLGFGYGAHGCAGQGLARLETTAVLRSLLAHVERIELAGEPQRAINNIIHRFESLPVRLVPARSA